MDYACDFLMSLCDQDEKWQIRCFFRRKKMKERKVICLQNVTVELFFFSRREIKKTCWMQWTEKHQFLCRQLATAAHSTRQVIDYQNLLHLLQAAFCDYVNLLRHYFFSIFLCQFYTRSPHTATYLSLLSLSVSSLPLSLLPSSFSLFSFSHFTREENIIEWWTS